MGSGKQKAVAVLTFVGAALFLLGVVIWFVMVGGGSAAIANRRDVTMLAYAGLPLALCAVGGVLALAGLYIGFREVFGRDSAAPKIDAPDAYIVACTVLDKRGQTAFDREMFEPEDLFYYVNVEFADGAKKEFRTVKEVFDTIGEGMRGTVSYQGKWLGKFVSNRPSGTSGSASVRP